MSRKQINKRILHQKQVWISVIPFIGGTIWGDKSLIRYCLICAENHHDFITKITKMAIHFYVYLNMYLKKKLFLNANWFHLFHWIILRKTFIALFSPVQTFKIKNTQEMLEYLYETSAQRAKLVVERFCPIKFQRVDPSQISPRKC